MNQEIPQENTYSPVINKLRKEVSVINKKLSNSS